MRKNLILGLVSGYEWPKVRLFVESLEASGFTGDLVLFCDQISGETCSLLEKHRAKLLPFRKFYIRNPINGKLRAGDGRLTVILRFLTRLIRLVPGLSPVLRDRWLRRHAVRYYHVANTRFILASEYLGQLRAVDYGPVMLTDVRDVLFQKAPFDFDLKDRVLAFNESRAISLENCRDYRTWIASAYGNSVLKEFEGKRISCCGITLGTFEGMSEYLDLMADGMITNRTREPYLFGLDSAVHNHLILRDKIPGLRVLENLEGPVLTMGGMTRDECLLDDAGRLVNRDRSVIPTIHQYDRHPEIAKVIERSLQLAGAR